MKILLVATLSGCSRAQPWPVLAKHTVASLPGSAGATRRVDDESKPSSRNCCAAVSNIGSARRRPRLGQAPRCNGGPVRRVRPQHQHRRPRAAPGPLVLLEGRSHHVRRRRLPGLYGIQEPERYHNGEKICPRPVRVDDVERVNRVTFTVFVRCEETGKAGGLVFKLEGDTLHI